MIPDRYLNAFILMGLIGLGGYYFTNRVMSNSLTDNVSWLHSALIQRHNVPLRIIDRGHGPVVKLNQKLVLEIDGTTQTSLILGAPKGPSFKLFRSNLETMVGLRQGAIFEPLETRAPRVKILKVCLKSPAESSVCEMAPSDGTAFPQFNKCLNPQSSDCLQFITKKFATRTETQEHPFIEYCILESEFKCLKLMDALIYLSNDKPTLAGRIGVVTESVALYLTDSSKHELEARLLAKGARELADYIIRRDLRDVTPQEMKIWIEASAQNFPVQQQIIERLSRSLVNNQYDAKYAEYLLLNCGATLPDKLKIALKIKASKR